LFHLFFGQDAFANNERGWIASAQHAGMIGEFAVGLGFRFQSVQVAVFAHS
jgi:hypothetical protein